MKSDDKYVWTVSNSLPVEIPPWTASLMTDMLVINECVFQWMRTQWPSASIPAHCIFLKLLKFWLSFINVFIGIYAHQTKYLSDLMHLKKYILEPHMRLTWISDPSKAYSLWLGEYGRTCCNMPFVAMEQTHRLSQWINQDKYIHLP